MEEFEDYHITPVGDLREHVCSSDCWCNPVQDEVHPNLFVHNSMDKRELYETGALKLN